MGTVPPVVVAPRPRAGTLVPPTLNIPASAKRGSYASWLMDGLAGSAPASGSVLRASFGSDGITWLEFTVSKPGSPARHAVCVTPGAKQAHAAKTAHLTEHAGRHHHHGHAAKHHLIPAKDRKYVPDVIIAVIVLGGLALLRRRGWL